MGKGAFGRLPASRFRPPATRLTPNVGAPGAPTRMCAWSSPEGEFSMSWNFAGASALCVPALNATAHEARARHETTR